MKNGHFEPQIDPEISGMLMSSQKDIIGRRFSFSNDLNESEPK